jgi:isochorismate synthase
MVPRTVLRTGALPDLPTGPLPTVRIAATVPTPEDHRNPPGTRSAGGSR